MILQALYELAQTEQLAEDLDFELRPVAYLVSLSVDGKATLVARAQADPGEQSRKPVVPKLPIPRQSGRTSADWAEFLVDNSGYVFGCNPTAEGSKAERLPARAALFRERVAHLATRLPPGSKGQQAVQRVLAFLDLPAEGRQGPFLQKWAMAGTEAERKGLVAALFAFECPDLDPAPVHLIAEVRQGWKSERATQSGALATCLVTGLPCTPIEKMPPIKGVPGGNAAGAALVSFNSKAFESYGLERNANAPISRDAAEAIATALNRLLDRNPKRPDNTSLPVQHLRLSADTVACFWAREGLPEGIEALFTQDQVENVERLLKAPWGGRHPSPLEDPSAFYTLILSGAQGRSMVRGHLESTTATVSRAILRFLSDLSVDRPFGKGCGPFPLPVLLRSLALQGKDENVPAELATDLYLSALGFRPISLRFLEAAIRRNRAEGPGKEPLEQHRFAARCALIRAHFARQTFPERKEISMSLDPNYQDPGYLLGRLLAILDKAQSHAIPGANATIVDRFYGSASTTPAAVFPSLLRRVQPHLAKIRGDEKQRWAYVQVEKALSEVTHLLEAKPLPKVLGLCAQGLFALGFHHQRQNFFSKSPATSESAN